MSKINIFSLGGQDENGKNCFVIEVDNDIYVINSGIQVPINNRYGVDGIIPDFDYLIQRKDRIKGIFITHGKDNSFASIPWMIMDLPGVNVYCSKFTKTIVENRISKYRVEHNDYKINIIEEETTLGKVKVVPFAVANSIPGSNGFIFKTPDGSIVFMSSFIIDDLGQFGKTDLDEIKKLAGDTLALMIDSGRSNFKGKSSDHKSVKPFIEGAFKTAKDDERIIVGAYDEEMFVVHEVFELAEKYNRPIAIYGSNFQRLYDMMITMYGTSHKFNFINFKDMETEKGKNAVILVTGTWSRLYGRFVRIVENNDLHLKIKSSDHMVMVCPPLNGLEVEYTVSIDLITQVTSKISEVTYNDYYSLRPASEDIEEMVKTLKPKYFIPIQALYRYLVVAKRLAVKNGVQENRGLVLENAKIAYFEEGELASQKARVKEFGQVLIDGLGVGDISNAVIREREKLSAGGFLTIVADIDSKTKDIIMNSINIKMLGVVAKPREAEVRKFLIEKLVQNVEQLRSASYREKLMTIRKRMAKSINRLIGKDPLVVVTFFEV